MSRQSPGSWLASPERKKLLLMPKQQEAGPSTGPEPDIELSKVPAFVTRVHFDGIRYTSRQVLRKQVRHLFSPDVSNFKAMMEACETARERLKQLGVFADLELLIDTPRRSSDGGKPGHYEVIFAVKEHKRLRMGVSVISSLDNRASLVSRGAISNLTGGAERFEVDWHLGMNRFGEQQRHFTFVKPLEDMPSVKFTAGLFDSSADLSWVQLVERSRGGFFGMQWPTFAGDHSLRLEGQWREMMTGPMGDGAKVIPMGMREECGHFLRCALRHDFRADGRDDPILPTVGGLAKMRQELAMGGAGHDQAHLLHDVEFQWNVPLFENRSSGACVSVQFAQSLGLIRSVSANQHISVADRFFLGGPLSMRGFKMRQAGPAIEETPANSAHLPHGGRAYTLSGVHLYSTLPFLGGRGFVNNFRLHAFANVGMISCREPRWTELVRLCRLFADESRLSCGLGIVVRLFGVARFEVNYCWPLSWLPSDRLHSGLQCGIGMEYQ